MGASDHPSERHVLNVIVDNEAGILAKIAGLFTARGYNIDSLTVAGDRAWPTLAELKGLHLHALTMRRARVLAAVRAARDVRAADSASHQVVQFDLGFYERGARHIGCARGA